MLSAQYFLWSVGVYGLVLWLPSIVKKLTGAGIGSTGLLSAIPYVAAVIAMLVASTLSDRTAHRRSYTVLPLVLAGVCFALSTARRDGAHRVVRPADPGGGRRPLPDETVLGLMQDQGREAQAAAGGSGARLK